MNKTLEQVKLIPKMSLINFVSRRLIHLPVYKGPHLGINDTRRKTIPDSEFEDRFNRIREIQNSKVAEASPFHIVWRNRGLKKLNRKQQSICRKLGNLVDINQNNKCPKTNCSMH